MDDLFDHGVRPIAIFLRAIARALIWLGWDLGFQIVGWSIGWLVCRTATLGQFPSEDIGKGDEAHWAKALLVDSIGLAFLCLAIWLVGRYVTSAT